MILDTNGSLFAEGTYTFRVAEVPQETEIKGYPAWQWTFETETKDGEFLVYQERFMVWLLAPLLRGLGFKEISPGKFDFEPEEALGREFDAKITHVTLDKGASAGKVVARLKDITPVASAETSHPPEPRTGTAPADPKETEIPF